MPKRPYGAALVAARPGKAAAPGACLICARKLPLERAHNRKLCGRLSCLRRYQSLRRAGEDTCRRKVLQRLPSPESEKKCLEVLECRHRVVVWKYRGPRAQRRCSLCRKGAPASAAPFDATCSWLVPEDGQEDAHGRLPRRKRTGGQ
jgi:hypothetical protein